LNIQKSLTCPKCGGHKFTAKYEATYVYSYMIDSDMIGEKNEDEFFPFLFDNRELKNASEYIQCCNCGNRFPCCFSDKKGIHLTILQKAIRADHAENPEFLG